jgi:hypothetical protein
MVFKKEKKNGFDDTMIEIGRKKKFLLLSTFVLPWTMAF